MGEYRRCFRDLSTITATCADYRAAATIDLEHDRQDLDGFSPLALTDTVQGLGDWELFTPSGGEASV